MFVPPIMLIWFAVGFGSAAAAQDAYWRALIRSMDRPRTRPPPPRAPFPDDTVRGITTPYFRRQYDPHYRAPSRSLGGGRGH